MHNLFWWPRFRPSKEMYSTKQGFLMFIYVQELQMFKTGSTLARMVCAAIHTSLLGRGDVKQEKMVVLDGNDQNFFVKKLPHFDFASHRGQLTTV